MTALRVQLQLAEAMGSTNRWFCSQACGREIDNPELLLAYFIKNGGATDFARRFDAAMGQLNRWYCSEFYGCDIRDPEVLWDYYTLYGSAQVANRARKSAADVSTPELCSAC